MMTSILRTVKWERRLHQLISLSLLLALCWGCATQYTPAPDPAFGAIRKALQDEYKDPGATSNTLEANLHEVKDRQIIQLLLDYLEDRRRKEITYNDNIGQAVSYLEQISGIKSHIHLTIAGPVYFSIEDWDKDIAQWQEWWRANKDYIVWDEQSSKLKVVRP